MSKVVVTTCWGVTSHNVLSIDLCLYRDMLADWQTKHVLWVRKTKPIANKYIRNVKKKIGYICEGTHSDVFEEI